VVSRIAALSIPTSSQKSEPTLLRALQVSSTMLSSTPETPSTSPSPSRKAPHCLNCKQPRKGHLRPRCSSSPFIEKVQADDATGENFTDLLVASKSMSIASHSPSNKNRQTADAIEDTSTDFTVALGSMAIASPELLRRDDQTNTFTRNRWPSDSQPPDLEDGGEGKASRFVRWQEDIPATAVTPNKTMDREVPTPSPVTGTLTPYTPYNIFTSSNTSKARGKIISATLPASEQDAANSDLSPSCTSTCCTQPLPCAMNTVERDMFIARLSDEAIATIYIVPKANVQAIVIQALP